MLISSLPATDYRHDDITPYYYYAFAFYWCPDVYTLICHAMLFTLSADDAGAICYADITLSVAICRALYLPHAYFILSIRGVDMPTKPLFCLRYACHYCFYRALLLRHYDIILLLFAMLFTSYYITPYFFHTLHISRRWLPPLRQRWHLRLMPRSLDISFSLPPLIFTPLMARRAIKMLWEVSAEI